jgi:RNA polymerase sigma-B factor
VTAHTPAPAPAPSGDLAVLVREHTALALRLARRFDHGHGDRSDLEQVALTGLVAAAQRFDPGRGVPFPRYLVATVLGELRHHVRDTAWEVRVPRGLQEESLAVRRTAEELTQELGRDPVVADLAAALGWSADRVTEAIAARSAGRPWSTRCDATVPDPAPAHDDRTVRRLDLRSAIGSLGARERRVLHLRFERDLSQREIGDELGCSQMQVSRILAAILRRLRTELSA